MIGLVGRRLAHAFAVIFGVTVLVFVITRVVGDPARAMLPLSATQEQREQYERALGLDQPMWDQFKDFAGALLQLDLGRSLWQSRPNVDIIAEALPRTFLLVTVAVTLAVVVAVLLGTLAALHAGGFLDRSVVGFSVLGLSVPQFWMGLMLVILLGVFLPVLPTSGSGSISHLVLPAITMALPQTGRLTMMVRSSMLESLGSAYMQTLTLKGLPHRRRVLLHGLRNASPPVLTLGAWEYVQGMAGYAVVVETVFAWPGMGYTALQAINNQDLPLLSALVLVTATVVVVVNFAVDIGYRLIDPRVSVEGRA